MAYFKGLSLYPYATDAAGKVQLLVRKTLHDYKGFGGHFVESDMSIIYTAARCLFNKSKHLLVPSNYSKLEDIKHIEEILSRTDLKSEFILKDPYIKDFLAEFIEKRDRIIRSIIANQIGLFMPIPHFNTEQINACLAGSKHSDVSMKFVPLEEAMDGWLSTLIPEIDQQLITRAYPRLIRQDNSYEEGATDGVAKKIAIILLEDHVNALFRYESFYMGSWFRENEHWVFYRAWKGELPSKEDLSKMKGMILTGSRHSVYEAAQQTWLEPVRDLIRDVRFNHDQVKLVGICFGHQLIAQALGGEVRRMSINVPTILENQEIHLTDSFYKFKNAKNIVNDKPSMYVVESHGDEVTKLPADAEITAWSPNTKVEGYRVGENIMCYQFHPEYSPAFIEYRMFNENSSDGKQEVDQEAKREYQKNTLKTLHENPIDRMLIINLIGEFLHS